MKVGWFSREIDCGFKCREFFNVQGDTALREGMLAPEAGESGKPGEIQSEETFLGFTEKQLGSRLFFFVVQETFIYPPDSWTNLHIP